MALIRGAMIEGLLAALGAAGFIFGLMLIYVGRRGKRVDAHPLCRKCGYDLTGRAEGSDRCAECGADLSPRRAIRVGNRTPRHPLFWTGLSITAIFLVLTSAFVWVQFSRVDLMQRKPVWLLRSDASSLLSNTRVPAVTELTRRFTAGELTDAHIQAIISDALVFQANPNFPWKEWDGLMNRILLAGKIGDADWVTLVKQSIRLNLIARPRIRAGDPMPVTLTLNTFRLPWMQPMGPGTIVKSPFIPPHFIEFQWLDAEISGVKIADIPPRRSHYPLLGSQSIIEGLNVNEAQTASLAEGKHRFSGHATVSILKQNSQVRLATFDVGVDTNVTILPASTDPKLFFVTDQAVTDAMLQTTWKVEVVPTSGFAARGMYRFDLRMGNAPAGLAHQAYLRIPDGREIEVGPVAIETTRAPTGFGTPVHAEIGQATAVDIILRPDFELVKNSTRSDPIWGEEIIFRNVKIMPPNVSTRTGSPQPTTLPRPGK